MDYEITKKACFLTHKESRFANQIWRSVLDCFSYVVYFYQIRDIQCSEQERLWFTQTQNAYYDSAVTNWCKLFGSYLEPIHYRNLLSGKYGFGKKLQKMDAKLINHGELKAYILGSAKIPEDEYKKFHAEALDYRNRNLIHPEHDPDKIKEGDIKYPMLEIMLGTSFALLKLLTTLFSVHPVFPNKSNYYRVGYFDFKNKKGLMIYLRWSFPLRLLKAHVELTVKETK